MSAPVKKLLATQMSRKQFLLHIGGVALAVTGAAGLMRALTSLNTPQRTEGYGSTPYGGNVTGARNQNLPK